MEASRQKDKQSEREREREREREKRCVLSESVWTYRVNNREIGKKEGGQGCRSFGTEVVTGDYRL